MKYLSGAAMLPKRVGEPSARPAHSARSRRFDVGRAFGGHRGRGLLDHGRHLRHGAHARAHAVDARRCRARRLRERAAPSRWRCSRGRGCRPWRCYDTAVLPPCSAKLLDASASCASCCGAGPTTAARRSPAASPTRRCSRSCRSSAIVVALLSHVAVLRGRDGADQDLPAAEPRARRSPGRIITVYMGSSRSNAARLTGFGLASRSSWSRMADDAHGRPLAQRDLARARAPGRLVSVFAPTSRCSCVGPLLLVGSASRVTTYLLSLSADVLADVLEARPCAALHVVPMAVSALAFFLVYRLVPHRQLPWRHALAGGVVAAVLFEAAKEVFAHLRAPTRRPTASSTARSRRSRCSCSGVSLVAGGPLRRGAHGLGGVLARRAVEARGHARRALPRRVGWAPARAGGAHRRVPGPAQRRPSRSGELQDALTLGMPARELEGRPARADDRRDTLGDSRAAWRRARAQPRNGRATERRRDVIDQFEACWPPWPRSASAPRRLRTVRRGRARSAAVFSMRLVARTVRTSPVLVRARTRAGPRTCWAA